MENINDTKTTAHELMIAAEYYNNVGPKNSNVSVEEANALRLIENASGDAKPELNGINRHLYLFGEVNELIIRATHENTLVEQVCRIIAGAGEKFSAWVVLRDANNLDLGRVAAWAGNLDKADSEEISLNNGAYAHHPCTATFHSGQAHSVADLEHSNITAFPGIYLIEHRKGSLIALPLAAGSFCFGVLMVHTPETNAFDAQCREILSRLAANLAFGIGILRSRREYEKNRAEIGYLAYHDSLTGLRNRRGLWQSLAFTLSQAKRHQWSAAVLFMDLDRFKLVNDTMGHEAGDELLKQVATRIRGATRASDLAARQGGDEFIVLLTGHKQDSSGDGEQISEMSRQAAHVAQKIIDAMAQHFVVHGREICLTASVGISLFPDDANDAETLLRHADSAMYWAREKSRGSYGFYSRELSERQTRRIDVERRLRAALDREDFRLDYQPIVDVMSGNTVGAEALLRWQTDDGIAIGPEEFIPIAEDAGLMCPLGLWVLAQACRQLRRWRIRKSGFFIAVNLSPLQLWHGGGMPRFLETVESQGVSPTDVQLELTEQTVASESERMEKALFTLHEQGFKLALDDFASGYSSIGRLKHLPVGTLKIDSRFIQDIPESEENALVTGAITELARKLGKRSHAKGIENFDQLNFLRSIDCQLGQGYYFSRGLSADGIDRVLEKQGDYLAGGD